MPYVTLDDLIVSSPLSQSVLLKLRFSLRESML